MTVTPYLKSALWAIVFGARDPDVYIMAWAALIDSGHAFVLGGTLGEVANQLVSEGVVSEDGIIGWDAWRASEVYQRLVAQPEEGSDATGPQ